MNKCSWFVLWHITYHPNQNIINQISFLVVIYEISFKCVIYHISPISYITYHFQNKKIWYITYHPEDDISYITTVNNKKGWLAPPHYFKSMDSGPSSAARTFWDLSFQTFLYTTESSISVFTRWAMVSTASWGLTPARWARPIDLLNASESLILIPRFRSPATTAFSNSENSFSILPTSFKVSDLVSWRLTPGPEFTFWFRSDYSAIRVPGMAHQVMTFRSGERWMM